jgi:hypothetical protein
MEIGGPSIRTRVQREGLTRRGGELQARIAARGFFIGPLLVVAARTISRIAHNRLELAPSSVSFLVTPSRIGLWDLPPGCDSPVTEYMTLACYPSNRPFRAILCSKRSSQAHCPRQTDRGPPRSDGPSRRSFPTLGRSYSRALRGDRGRSPRTLGDPLLRRRSRFQVA